jgi:hypothetical protein
VPYLDRPVVILEIYHAGKALLTEYGARDVAVTERLT